MKSVLLLVLTLPLLLALPRTADASTLRLGDSSAQVRLGWDTNPIGSHGTSAALLGDAESLTTSVSAGFALLQGRSGDTRTFKLAYAGERHDFSHWSSENFTTHRLAFAGQQASGDWKTTWDASSLFIDGSRSTLRSVASANANAVALWRERRRQWQQRLKAQTQTSFEHGIVRGSISWLDYDYRTEVNAANVPFANRSDSQAGLDVGWRQSATSLWLAGVRTGRQTQAIVPLPNCAFDYSNRYQRLAVGWEGTPSPQLSVALLAGPDFRHYSGQIDPSVFPDRDRTSLWCEGNFTAKPTSSLTLAGRLARFEWLSSTGKSAYRDSCAELGLTWNARPGWTARSTAKLHRCDYYPAVRDDWEAFVTAGLSHSLSRHTTFTLDVTHHRAWNNLDTFPERDFGRWIFSAALTWKN
jgi:hypothetical protein